MQIATDDINSNNNKGEEENKLYTNFIYSLKTEVTRELYLKCIKYYMKFVGVKTLRELVDAENKPQKIIESDIKAYLVYLRNKKKISYRYSNYISCCYKKILLCE